MSFLSSFATSVTKQASDSYNQLRGPAGAPQSASETIDKLCDRLANATLVEDRRAALLGLKGLSRDWKAVSCGGVFGGVMRLIKCHVDRSCMHEQHPTFSLD